MLRMFFHAKRWALVAAVCISAYTMTGCLESSFRIASDSRLPQGMAIPPGLTRGDVSATVDYYTLRDAKFILRDKNGKKVGMVTGHIKGNHVLRLKTPPPGSAPGYPTYLLIDINGTTEIMEHRRKGDILYITDDPAIREELLAGGAGK